MSRTETGQDHVRKRFAKETAAAGRFAVVGVAATATHAFVATTLLQAGILAVFPANVAGFLVAFGVSFAGHYFWSFGHLRTGGSVRKSLFRFLFLALAGFALNNAVLATWLGTTPWPETIGLVVSILIVPAMTFLGARLWAFSHPDNASSGPS